MVRREQSAREMFVDRQQTSLSCYQGEKDVKITLLRQHFFDYMSRKHPRSASFMRTFWRLACRWRRIMGLPGEKPSDPHADHEETSQLFDDFMRQVELWQNKFRTLARDSSGAQVQTPQVTALIQKWKNDVKQHETELAPDIEMAFAVDLGKSKASLVDHWVKEVNLRRLNAYWMLLDDKKVVTVVNFLGAESVRFMRCLSVHITAQHLEIYEDLFDRVVNRRYQFMGREVATAESTFDAICSDVGEDDEVLELQVWDALAPDDPSEQQWRYEKILYPVPQKVEIEFYWCGIHGLLTHSKIEVISALSVCDETSGMFKPIVSRALFQHHWRHCHYLFMLDRTMDLVSLGCLCLIVFMTKTPDCTSIPSLPDDPPGCLDIAAQLQRNSRTYLFMLVVSGINLIMLFQVVSEAFCAVFRGIRSWFTSYNLFLVGMELYTLYLLWTLLGIVPPGPFAMEHNFTTISAPGAVEHSIFAVTLKERPVLFCALILFKWAQFLVGYLVTDIGKTVLPAVYAMKSGDSVKFVVYMALAILACTHAYWSLPLEPDDYESSGKFGSAYISFFRMFRLCVMGDFDIWELEGIDGAVDAEGYVDEPPEAWTNTTAGLGKSYYFHGDIRIIIMAFGTVLTIMLMNMYIGVLSLAYESFLSIKLEVFSHAKSKFMLRYLLRRRAWRRVVECFLDKDAMEDEPMPRILQAEAAGIPHRQMLDLLDEGGVDEDSPPPGWVEKVLVHKQHWVGFWTTVPQNLTPTEGADVMYQHMEDNQGSMVDKLDEIESTVAGISGMVDTLLRNP